MLPFALHNSADLTHATSFLTQATSFALQLKCVHAPRCLRHRAILEPVPKPTVSEVEGVIAAQQSGGVDRDTAEMGVAILRDLDRRRRPGVYRRLGSLGRHCPHPVLHLPRDLPGAPDPRAYDLQGVASGLLSLVV